MNTEDSLDAIFQALANAHRRRMMDLVREHPGCSVNDLCKEFEFSRIAVMKHLQVLVDATLVISRKVGRSRQLYFNAAPIQMVYDRWSDEYSRFWASQVVDLKYAAENAEGLLTGDLLDESPQSSDQLPSAGGSSREKKTRKPSTSKNKRQKKKQEPK